MIRRISEYRKRKKALKLYGEYYENRRPIIEDILTYYKKENKKIAIWGAGLKGEALLMIIEKSSYYIDYVFDIDKKKCGNQTFSNHTIVDYKNTNYKDIEVVLIMNNTNENEVVYLLKEIGYQCTCLNLDSIIEGELTASEAIALYDKTKKALHKEIIQHKEDNKEIAAVVFLYNFDGQSIENIKTYAKDIDVIYAFDNSDCKNLLQIEELKKISNVIYVDGGGNQGLSKAIIITAELAIESGYKWFYTFDQDSKVEETMIDTMMKFIKKISQEERDKLAIVCPMIQDSKEFAKGDGKYSYQSSAIQSGTMINLEIYQKLGGYDKELFVYFVDIDYCFRARMNQYQIVKLNQAILFHDTEDVNLKYMRIKGKRIVIGKYSEGAYYYITRNALICARRFKKKEYLFYVTTMRRLEVLLRGLPYEKHRFKKMKAIFFGFLDYLLERTGKCRWDL